MVGQVPRSKKAFTIVEEFIQLSAIDMCREIIGGNTASKHKLIPLSNNTITRRIIEMSDDIECKQLERIESSPYYSIQLDESIVLVRHLVTSMFTTTYFFCKELPTITTAEEIFRCLDTYFGIKAIE